MNQFCMRSKDRAPTIARGMAPGWARRLAAVLMAGAVAAVPTAWSQAQNSIRAITTTTEGGNDVVRVELDKPLTELPKGFSIQSPARIALDLAGVGNSTGRTSLELNQGNIKSANVVEAGDRTRVVLNLGQASLQPLNLSVLSGGELRLSLPSVTWNNHQAFYQQVPKSNISVGNLSLGGVDLGSQVVRGMRVDYLDMRTVNLPR